MRHCALLTGLLLSLGFGLVGCNSNPDAPSAPSVSSVPAGDGSLPEAQPGDSAPKKKGTTGAAPLER